MTISFALFSNSGQIFVLKCIDYSFVSFPSFFFVQFNSGQDAFYYQLFVEKNDDWILPNVQQLFEQSFKTSNIKLREVPPSLIIQMPRFGKNYKMYPRIVPSQVLDITDVVEGRKLLK